LSRVSAEIAKKQPNSPKKRFACISEVATDAGPLGQKQIGASAPVPYTIKAMITVVGEKSPLHKFALSFRLSGEQTAQAGEIA
jgi:hypothetical protein